MYPSKRLPLPKATGWSGPIHTSFFDVGARLSDGLTAYLEHRSTDAQARAEWVELLRWSPKGFTYDRPSVETFRRRLTALARVVAADLDSA